jgi:hypothetical protein
VIDGSKARQCWDQETFVQTDGILVLSNFFTPASIALVSAADDPTKRRGKLLKLTLVAEINQIERSL